MKSILPRVCILALCLLLFIPQKSQAATEKRIALIIGNGNYEASPLRNPVNDATDMAASLKNLGFSIILKTDAAKRDMGKAVEDFGKRLKGGDVGLFYYAGHGIQVNGVNYLIPVGAKINDDTDVEYEALDAGRILSKMYNAKSRVNIVILDACRDNPYVRSFRSATRGLAIISKAPSGTIISYSTSPGDVALDGKGRNSPYTAFLLRYINEPGIPIEQVFKSVRQQLGKETGGKQIPWELSSLEGEFFFVPGIVTKGADVSPSGRIASDRDKTPLPKSASTDELDDETRKLERAERKLEKASRVLTPAALNKEQKKLQAWRNRLEEKKKQLAIAKEPPTQVSSKPAISPEKQITEVPLPKRFPIPESSESIISKEKEYMEVAKVVPSPLVSVNEIRRDGRFIAYDNGTVLDESTNLMWAAKDNGYNINWQDAKKYCENYRGGGYTDWRMPTQEELEGLYDKGKGYNPACAARGETENVYLTNLITLSCWYAWTSKTRGPDAAYYIRFINGSPNWYSKSYDGGYRALPVRSGK